MITQINYDTVQAALDDTLEKGGRIFWNTDDDTAVWFPFTVLINDALMAVRGTGLLALWGEINYKVNGPVCGAMGH